MAQCDAMSSDAQSWRSTCGLPMNPDQKVAFDTECKSLSENDLGCLASRSRLYNCLASAQRTSCGLDPSDSDHPCHAEASSASTQCASQTDTIMASMLDEPALLAKLNGVMGGPPSSYDERKITAGVDAPGGGSEKKPASANALARPDFQLTCSANGKFVDDPYDCCSYTAKVQVFPNGTRKQVCVAGPPASAVATTKSPQRMALDAQFAKNAIREKCLQDIEKLDKSQRDEETKANSELMHSSLSPSPASVTTSEGAPISICTSVGCMSENTQCAVESGGYITCTAGFDMSKGFSITQSQSGYNLMYDDKYCRLDATRQVVCDSSAANAEAFHITSSSPSTLAMTIFDAKNSLTRFCNVENNRFTCNSTHDKTDFGFRIF